MWNYRVYCVIDIETLGEFHFRWSVEEYKPVMIARKTLRPFYVFTALLIVYAIAWGWGSQNVQRASPPPVKSSKNRRRSSRNQCPRPGSHLRPERATHLQPGTFIQQSRPARFPPLPPEICVEQLCPACSRRAQFVQLEHPGRPAPR